MLLLSVGCRWALGQRELGQPEHGQREQFTDAALPDAPQAQQRRHSPLALTLPPGSPYARIVEPAETPQPLSPREKLIFSLREATRPVVLAPALYSASYEQLVGSDPKYGSDSAAYGEKLGAAMLRSTTIRLLGDGVFAAAFRQDPRYYRIGEGGIVQRGLRSAEQALVRRGDDGSEQVNYSGLMARAAAASLTLAYYPAPSANRSIVLSTFGIAILGDAGGNLVTEFWPDVARRVPLLRKVPLF